MARRRGDIAQARRHLSRAARESERLAARILDEQWRASFWADWGVPHQELAALELESGRTAAAFEALERGRGRALASPRRGRSRPLPPAVRAWAASGLARDRDRSSRGSLPAEAPVAARQPARLRRLLDRADTAHPVGARQLDERLPEGVRLLDYFEHRGTVGAFRADRRDLRVNPRLASRAHLERLVHEVLFELRRAAIERPSQDAGSLTDALTELASLILWPALPARELPRTLAVVPVAPLTRLPWAALPLPDGRRLGEATRIVVVPGLRLGLSRSKRERGTAGGLVVASAAAGLERVGPEAESVRNDLAPATLLEGSDATAARFLAESPNAAWIHFAGHGFFQDGSAGLKLSALSAEISIDTETATANWLSALCQGAHPRSSENRGPGMSCMT